MSYQKVQNSLNHWFHDHFHLRVFGLLVVSFGLLFTLIFSFNVDLRMRHLVMKDYPTSEDVVIVSIDDAVLAEYGGWPLRRSDLGGMIASMLDHNPRKLAIDMIFQERELDLEDKYLNSLLVDPRVVVARNNLPEFMLDQDVLDNVHQASATYPLAADGKIYQVPALSAEGVSLGASLVSKTHTFPQAFYLNPNIELPPIFSIVDIINEPSLEGILEDKYVLFGSTSESLSDYYQIPRFNYVPGVVIHAIVLNQILQQEFPQDFTLSPSQGAVILLSLAVLLSIRVIREFPHWLWLELIFFSVLLWFTPVVELIPISVLATFTLGLVASYSTINLAKIIHDKFHLKRALSGHFSPVVMNTLLAEPDMHLGGEKSEITVLFTDLRGFTKFSEQIDPREVGQVLNKVLGMQADTIIQNDGVVDKFIGDAVMGFWGAPIIESSHAYKGLVAACEIVQKFNKIKQKEGFSFDVGIGLYSGPAVVGNFGSERRFNYTVIGDTVNTASRIENLTKEYHSKILVGEEVLLQLSEKQRQEFRVRLEDSVQPRGKTSIVQIYSVTAFKTGQKWFDLETMEFEKHPHGKVIRLGV
jgi:class 3 adenylate cyclase